jgi:hypothetical protein
MKAIKAIVLLLAVGIYLVAFWVAAARLAWKVTFGGWVRIRLRPINGLLNYIGRNPGVALPKDAKVAHGARGLLIALALSAAFWVAMIVTAAMLLR